MNDRIFDAVAGHVRRTIGPIEHVFCAPGPKIVHVDILHVPPTRARRCQPNGETELRHQALKVESIRPHSSDAE